MEEIEGYYADRRSHPVNYENCCYVVTQLCDTEDGEFDNPAVQPLIEKLKRRSDLAPLLETKDARLSLFTEAKHFIKDIVWRLLSRPPATLAYLDWLVDGIRDDAPNCVDFLTLNHDIVLEQALRARNVRFSDGFGEPSDGVRFWDPDLLEQKHPVRICKLHGSIDWFWFRPNRRVGIPAREVAPGDAEVRPELLVGTFNKMHQYTASVFADLHCHFHRVLQRANSLIVCGYGFGDKGINTKMIEWIDAEKRRRMVVVHHDPQALIECSRGAIANYWQRWKNEGKIFEVNKRIEQTTWADVKLNVGA